MTSEKPRPRHGHTRRERLLAAGPPAAATLVAVALVILAVLIRPHVLTATCRVTGCGPQAMAVAGWAMPLVPFWLICLVLVLERLAVRIPLALLTTPLVVLAVAAFPARGGQTTGTIPPGPVAADFLTGARCGQIAILLTVGAGMCLGLGGGARFRRGRASVSLDQVRRRVRAVATGAAIAAITLLVAVYAAL